MYSHDEFVERFKDMETSWLTHRLATTEMTQEARDAIHDILLGRGVPMANLDGLRPELPEQEVAAHALAIKRSQCPRCRTTVGGLDIHRSYWVWSAVFLTRWHSKRELCCRKCGDKQKWGALASSFFLGWWGFPFGLLITPVQVVRNIAALARSSDPTRPSKDLLDVARNNLLIQRRREVERLSE